MRNPIPARLEAARHTSVLYSEPSWGAYGMFRLPGPNGAMLRIVASAGNLPGDDTGWEHASVSREPAKFTPNWSEMCFVKDLFWNEDECVMQFHPPRTLHVNNHPTCLHLFRPVDGIVRMPPPEMVGIKDAGEGLNREQAAEVWLKFWAEDRRRQQR